MPDAIVICAMIRACLYQMVITCACAKGRSCGNTARIRSPIYLMETVKRKENNAIANLQIEKWHVQGRLLLHNNRTMAVKRRACADIMRVCRYRVESRILYDETKEKVVVPRDIGCPSSHSILVALL